MPIMCRELNAIFGVFIVNDILIKPIYVNMGLIGWLHYKYHLYSYKNNCAEVLVMDKMQIKYHELIFYMANALNFHIFFMRRPRG